MSRVLLVLTTCFFSACSLWFDPAKAVSLACPQSAAACPMRANSSALCGADAGCDFACSTGFEDTNGSPLDGCETNCTMGPASPVNPSSLVLTAGAASGALEASWPMTQGARYRVCHGPLSNPAAVCDDVASHTACWGDGGCAATLAGLTDNVREVVRVQALSCGKEGAASDAPVASATPFDAWSGSHWSYSPFLGVGTATWDQGTVTIDHAGPFTSSMLLTGDSDWKDFTFEADVRWGTGSQAGLYSGLAVRVSGSQYRFVAGASSDVNEPMSLVQHWLNDSVKVATSVRRLEGDAWHHLRVVAKEDVVAVFVRPEGEGETELFRFRDPVYGPLNAKGQLGFASASQGRVQFKSIRATTRSVLPPAGPESVAHPFNETAFPPPGVDVRGGANAVRVPCPSWPAAAGCVGSACVPKPGSTCVSVNSFLGGGLSFDTPVGLDPHKPWRVSLKFAPVPGDAGVPWNVRVLDTAQRPVVTTVGADWNKPLQVLGRDAGVALIPGAWNRLEVELRPPTFRFLLNAVDATPGANGFPEATRSPRLGAFSLGGGNLITGNAFRAYVTDIEVGPIAP